MKLVDGMKDEKLGSALLYCFTKGYGAVSMDLYNVVLPLLFDDIFREEINTASDFAGCIKVCVKKDGEFVNRVLANIDALADITNRALGIALLNKDLDFNIQDGIMSGSARPSSILDLNEAIILGEMLKGKSLEEVISLIKSDFKIVFLDSETLGEDIDLSKLNQYGDVTIYNQSEVAEIASKISEANVVITNKHILD